MVPQFITSGVALVLGTLYPAYASYKAVKTKNVREYVKWMMYWIVFAIFTSFESFADLFIAFWFPFYNETKLLVLLWLISPVSESSVGAGVTYRKLVHPQLLKREAGIERMIRRAREQGYNAAARLARQAGSYLGTVVAQTAAQTLPRLQCAGSDVLDLICRLPMSPVRRPPLRLKVEVVDIDDDDEVFADGDAADLSATEGGGENAEEVFSDSDNEEVAPPPLRQDTNSSAKSEASPSATALLPPMAGDDDDADERDDNRDLEAKAAPTGRSTRGAKTKAEKAIGKQRKEGRRNGAAAAALKLD